MTVFDRKPARANPDTGRTRPLRRAAGKAARLGMGGLLMLANCLAQASGGVAAPVGDEAGLRQRIQQAIGDARCDSDAQCRTLPVGEKSCGGPQQWLAWSTTSPQAAKLPGWAAESAAAARQRNADSGLVGNCQYNPDPGAVCKAQRCVLGAALSVR